MSATATSSEFELAKPDDGFAGGLESTAADLKRFHRWLIAALLFHAALLTGLISTGPRQLGDASGMDDAISVSLVTESELRGNATVADRAAGEPVPPPQLRQAVPEPQENAPPEPEEAPTQPPPDAQAAATPPQPEPAPKPEAAPEPAPSLRDSVLPAPPPEEDKSAKPAEPSTDKHEPTETPEQKKPAPDSAHKAKPKPPDAKAAPAKPKKTQTAKLDLSMPKAFQAPPGSRGAGFERPAGITRSGENDDFARRVIRALQGTMPQLRETRGRVRVRITLNRNGNLVSTRVEMPSNVPGLDQSVVFATKQTSFPLPPYNANDADLVFIVTYIYQ